MPKPLGVEPHYLPECSIFFLFFCFNCGWILVPDKWVVGWGQWRDGDFPCTISTKKGCGGSTVIIWSTPPWQGFRALHPKQNLDENFPCKIL